MKPIFPILIADQLKSQNHQGMKAIDLEFGRELSINNEEPKEMEIEDKSSEKDHKSDSIE